MAGKQGAGQAMSRFDHFVVKLALMHNAAVKAALALDPASLKEGRSPAEAEVSRLSVLLFEKLHTIPALARQHPDFYDRRSYPLTETEKHAL